MSFVLSEEQEAIRKSARDVARARMSVAVHRALRDGRDASGYSREGFAELASLGLVGVAIDEAYGGAGLHEIEHVLITEELAYGCTGIQTSMTANALAATQLCEIPCAPGTTGAVC